MAKNDQAPAEGATDTSAQSGSASAATSADVAPNKVLGPDGRATPEEWAKELGRTVAIRITRRVGRITKVGFEHKPDPIHAAAATLHGWGAHAFHANTPIRLTREEYEGAIKAVLDWGKKNPKHDPKDAKSKEPPTLPLKAHAPALSKHHPLERQKAAQARSDV